MEAADGVAIEAVKAQGYLAAVSIGDYEFVTDWPPASLKFEKAVLLQIGL